MTKVVPAIHVASPEEYYEQLKLIRKLTNRFQLDIIDPEFADSPTVDMSLVEVPTGMLCDVHIMSPHPDKYIEAALALRPNLIILQFESVEGIEGLIEDVKSKEFPVGLAINPKTTVEEVSTLVPLLDHCLIMGYPAGPAGQKFQPGVLRKVSELRALKPTLEVGLDGGVNDESLAKIAKAQFDIVNTTTYLFSAPDVLTRYSELMEQLA